MIIDNNLVFSNAQSLITNSTTASTFILDLATGATTSASTYSAPNMAFGNLGGTATVFGEDLGIGPGYVPQFLIALGASFVTSTSATLNVAIQGAVDNQGGAGTFAGLSWTTYDETGAIAAANLLINTSIRMWWPHRAINAGLPRFIRLLYQLPAATAFTAGSVTLAAVVLNRDDWSAGLYPSNFQIGA